MCKGCCQDSVDQGDTDAIAPLLISLELLLIVGISEQLSFTFDDISTACMHAEPNEEVYVMPPVEFYPDCGMVWNLSNAMHVLKTAPKA